MIWRELTETRSAARWLLGLIAGALVSHASEVSAVPVEWQMEGDVLILQYNAVDSDPSELEALAGSLGITAGARLRVVLEFESDTPGVLRPSTAIWDYSSVPTQFRVTLGDLSLVDPPGFSGVILSSGHISVQNFDRDPVEETYPDVLSVGVVLKWGDPVFTPEHLPTELPGTPPLPFLSNSNLHVVLAWDLGVIDLFADVDQLVGVPEPHPALQIAAPLGAVALLRRRRSS